MLTSNASVDTFSIHPRDDQSGGSGEKFLTGVLKKRKRKRHQGYARRFFSLDFTSSTLSYYLSKESSTLRGAIPLSLAVTSANQNDREICIDSGAEVWHLRAFTDQEWEKWKSALERATQQAMKAGTTGDEDTVPPLNPQHVDSIPQKQLDNQGWADVEALVGRVAGIRDAVRRLATTSEPPPPSPSHHSGESGVELSSSAASIMSSTKEERKPFWKRKTSGGAVTSSAASLHPRDAGRNKSIVAAMAGPAMATAMPNGAAEPLHQENMHAHLTALLQGLDSVVADFSRLVAENKQRKYLHRMSTMQQRAPSPMANRISKRVSRISIADSEGSDEFFDAEDALTEAERGRVVLLNDDESDTPDEAAATDDDESSDAENDSFDGNNRMAAEKFNQDAEAAAADGVRDLRPLPCEVVQRRTLIPPAIVLPPSLIGFLRKNVGKDLSTIAMPVSANEPTSLLQRLSEQLEYSELLNEAVNAPKERGERLLYVAAFATSSFSNCRVKDRSIRKPFNPMLGETYELVREDKGIYFSALQFL